MKNTFIFWGIIVLVAVIGFTMTACGGGSGGDGGGGNAFLGDKLEISGEQVYTEDYDTNYKQYTGSANIHSSIEGNGAITNGKLTYTIETPTSASLSAISDVTEDMFGYYDDEDDEDVYYYWDNITISDTNVKVYELTLYTTNYYYVTKANSTYRESGYSASGTDEYVGYMYVDKDVTISGKGKTTDDDGVKFTTKNFNLSLKKGWNAVYTKSTWTETMTATSETISVSLSNPNLKWVIDSDNYYYDYDYSVLGPPKAFKRLPRTGN
jgi:hypothetical protein